MNQLVIHNTGWLIHLYVIQSIIIFISNQSSDIIDHFILTGLDHKYQTNGTH